MKIYAAHGHRDFVICLGYKGYVIKEFFANYFLHVADVTFDIADNRMAVHQKGSETWRVTLVDTGEASKTGGRLKPVERYVAGERFCFTYGDGVASVDVCRLVDLFHKEAGRHRDGRCPPGRFGALDLEGTRVRGFVEKPAGEGGCINAGFFVLEPQVFRYRRAMRTSGSRAPRALACDGQLGA